MQQQASNEAYTKCYYAVPSIMTKRDGFGKEEVKQDGNMKVNAGSVIVTRDGEEVGTALAGSTIAVKKGDLVYRSTSADYNLPGDT